MRAAVGDVIKLVRPHRIVGFFGQAARGVHEMPRVGIRRSGNKHEFSAKRAQRVFFLLALRFGHDDDRLIPQRIGHERKADARVTRRPFHNRAAGLQQPLPFSIAHNVQSSAIFYRRAGIGKFALAEDVATGGLAWAFQADQRCVAN